jgi:hypothetical protein
MTSHKSIFSYLPSAITAHFFLFIFLVGWFCSPLMAQNGQTERRSFHATPTSVPPKIDGLTADQVWQDATPVSGFFQYEPFNDRAASLETIVRVLYDDNAIYIAATMLESSPDSILTEVGLRDSGEQLNADRFWVDINPFNDGVNGFRFQVSASGVQTDINISGAGTSSSGSGGRRGDSNWDAVWTSAVQLTDTGWSVEMAIPYAALRFPKGEVHEWGINFWREIRRTRELSSWNFVNRRIGDVLASMGVMNGIEGIKPPLRLAFFPYISGYMEKNGGGQAWASTFNGGMDVKLGISPAFTLDVTLIPDFGQVQSDALVLNLSPYEVKYDEKRQFFTEGTELFSKADLFYSRRVGARPKGYARARQHLDDHEVVRENPIETRMINATKLSGRTSSGLGIGIFNAMTDASHAILEDTLSGSSREVTTQPFTNYNLLVVDQSLRNNSFVSLVNTNVTGSEKGYTANVTGTEFRILDNTNMFRIAGRAALSQQYYHDHDNNFGHKYSVEAGKVGGTWQYDYTRTEISNTYEQNDMGFLRRNNMVENEVSLSHNIFDPFGRLLNMTNRINIEYATLYKPRSFTELAIDYGLRMLFDTRFFINLGIEYKPLGQRDYYEPRAQGRFFETAQSFETDLMFSSDYRKKVYIDGNLSYEKIFSAHDQQEYSVNLRPTFRASDRLNLSAGFDFSEKINDLGYVKQLNPDSVYFGKRQAPTITNTLRTTYIFTNTLSLDFALRHYWSRALYDGDYYFLQENGKLQPIDDDLNIHNISYNAFTIDMKLTWNFAPGSQLTAVWKNMIDNRANQIPDSFMDNITHVFDLPQINSLSIKLLYYLDYHFIKKLTSTS